jgi:hypothetical protein
VPAALGPLGLAVAQQQEAVPFDTHTRRFCRTPEPMLRARAWMNTLRGASEATGNLRGARGVS